MYFIWIEHYKDGQLVGASVSAKCYKRKGYAERVARGRLSKTGKDGCRYEWIVSETNPWRQKD